MDIPAMCAACQRPGLLTGCHLCGAQVHAACLAGGLHTHGRMASGPSDPKM